VSAEAEAGEGVRLTGLRRPLKEYEGVYGKNLRTLKRWRARGVEVGEACPLDDPEELRVWWARWMTQVLPAGIAGAVVKERVAGVVVPEPLEVVPVAEVAVGELGLAGALERMEKMELTLHAEAGKPGGTKPWLDTIARMSAMQTKIREELEKGGKLLPKGMVEQAIVEFHGPIEREVRLMFQTMCGILGLAPSALLEGQWNKSCDEMFARLQEEVLR